MVQVSNSNEGFALLRNYLLTPSRANYLNILELLSNWPEDGSSEVAYHHARSHLKLWADSRDRKMMFPLLEKLGEVEPFVDAMIYCPQGQGVQEAFYMGQTQVTQALWAAVMGNNPSHFKGDNLPVETVSWFDCVEFCNRLSQAQGLTPAYRIGQGKKPNVEWIESANGYRLPFEDEWEHAAKAGENYEYAGSDNPDEVAWYHGNSDSKTHPVAQKKPNAWGLYDMSGNVWEWCYDSTNNGAYRVFRGGSWSSDASSLRAASRDGYSPTVQHSDVGGRLARSIP